MSHCHKDNTRPEAPCSYWYRFTGPPKHQSHALNKLQAVRQQYNEIALHLWWYPGWPSGHGDVCPGHFIHDPETRKAGTLTQNRSGSLMMQQLQAWLHIVTLALEGVSSSKWCRFLCFSVQVALWFCGTKPVGTQVELEPEKPPPLETRWTLARFRRISNCKLPLILIDWWLIDDCDVDCDRYWHFAQCKSINF